MEYIDIIKQNFDLVNKTQAENMKIASNYVAKTIENDGLIYIFGCGHSHLIALDCFYRAGGLANVYPILDGKLMLHESASYSSVLEKDETSVNGLLNKYNITDKDVLIVISVSGKNGSPVQMAIDGQNKGVKVIGIGSSSYFGDKPKHSSGKLLKDVCDVFIDNCVPHGDAVCDVGLNGVLSAPISTPITSFIMQNVIVMAERTAGKNGSPVQMAIDGQNKGVKVIGIGSSSYFGDKPKHSSGKLLKDVCDVFIDNCVPHGDAVCDVGLNGVLSAPISTPITSFIMQNIIVMAERTAVKNGAKPAIFMSGNIEGGAEYNVALIEKYKKRINCL